MKAKNFTKNLETNVISINKRLSIPNDSLAASSFFHSSDIWNHVLYSYIIENFSAIKINKVQKIALPPIENSSLDNNLIYKSKLKNFIFYLSMYIAKYNNIFYHHQD